MFESITKDNYEAALARVLELMDAEPGTPEGEDVDRLAAVIDVRELNQIMDDLHANVIRRSIT